MRYQQLNSILIMGPKTHKLQHTNDKSAVRKCHKIEGPDDEAPRLVSFIIKENSLVAIFFTSSFQQQQQQKKPAIFVFVVQGCGLCESESHRTARSSFYQDK